MSYLKQARLRLGLSQTYAAQRMGISRQKLNRLEGGRSLATPAQARAIREVLGVQVLSVQELGARRRLQERAGVRPFELDLVNPEPWAAAWKFWGERLLRAGLDQEVWGWMTQFLASDSSRESYAWGQFAGTGARPLLGSPVEMGFEQHVLVDRPGRLLGMRLLPCLSYESKGLDYVLWPQMWVCTGEHSFRADALLYVRLGQRRAWVILEIDGSGHDSSRDAYRSQQLQMLEVRVTGEEVRQGRMVELTLQRLNQALERGLPCPRPPDFRSGWRRGRRAR